MNWLWIPAVVILALFVFVLCWLFFSDYTCCPCVRKRNREPILPTHVDSSVFLPSDPSQQYQPSAPQHYPVTPSESPHLKLKDDETPPSAHADAQIFSISASLPPSRLVPKPEPQHVPKPTPQPAPRHVPKPAPQHAPIHTPQNAPILMPKHAFILTPKPAPIFTPQPAPQHDTKSASQHVPKPRHVPEPTHQHVPKPHQAAALPDLLDHFPKLARQHEPTPPSWPAPKRRRQDPLPAYEIISETTHYPAPKTPSQYYPGTPPDSPHLHLKYADLSIRKVFRTERGILTLDLHNMTVKEAIELANDFIDDCIGEHHKINIVTGRGVHSRGGQPKLKPAIIRVLENQDIEYCQTNNGGCLEIVLPDY